MINLRRTIFFLILVGILPSLVHAAGMYHIGKDEGGVYMDTDQDGSWYIDPDHIRDFSMGEEGTYTIKADSNGIFLLTSKGKKYYINRKAQERWENELQTFNEKQRQKLNETQVNLLDGNHVLIPVTLGYGRNELKITMLLDTGASITVLHQDVAEKLNLKSISKAKLMIAGGQVLNSDIVKLDYAKVGPIKKQKFEASVIQHTGPPTPYEGLLGMNFLKGLDYRIDYERELILWKP